MKLTPKEKAKKLFDYHHKLITNVGGELAQEILVSILAEQCALFFARKMLKEKWDAKKYNEYEYWNEVNVEIVNYANFKL
jgi:hypothetical protein